jgi:predicted ATP-grasp superfamily ATP-dependent carboligase
MNSLSTMPKISQPRQTALAAGEAKPKGSKATILVTDCGRGSAIAMIRALSRHGFTVIAGDSVSQNVRFGSRYAAKRFQYPSPKLDTLPFVDSICEIVKRLNVDLIIPITDEALLPLSQFRSKLPVDCQLATPDPSTLELTTNKLKTIELANQLGVPVPQTAIVSTAEDACRQASTFSWPIVLKPLVSRLYRQGQPIHALTVSYADDLKSLERQMQQFEGLTEVLLQEYVHGTGYGVEFLTHEGRPITVFQHKRLREVPVTGGASSLRQSVALDPVLFDYASRMLEKLRWTGLAMVEFKVGKEGPRLMEINGRVWGSLPLAVHSGANFPVALAEMYLHGPPHSAPQTDYRVGVRGRNLELDTVWMMTVLAGKKRYSFLPMPKRSAAVAAILSLFNPRIRFDILSLRDPLPGMAELMRIATKLVKKSRDSLA